MSVTTGGVLTVVVVEAAVVVVLAVVVVVVVVGAAVVVLVDAAVVVVGAAVVVVEPAVLDELLELEEVELLVVLLVVVEVVVVLEMRLAEFDGETELTLVVKAMDSAVPVASVHETVSTTSLKAGPLTVHGGFAPGHVVTVQVRARLALAPFPATAVSAPEARLA